MTPHPRKMLYKLLGVAAGLVFVAFGVNERREFSKTHARGQRAVLDPVSEYQQFGSAGSPTYTAELSFKTEDGRQIRVKHSFPEEVLEDFKAGKPVEVVYAPNDPSAFVFVNEKPSWTLILVGVGLAVAALVLA